LSELTITGKSKVSHYRSSMVKRFGLLYYVMAFPLFLRRVVINEASVERIRKAEEAGDTIVYAMRTRSFVDYIALNRELVRHGLPLASFGTGVSTIWFQPFFAAVGHSWRRLGRFLTRGRIAHPVTSGWFARHVSEGNCSAVFLRAPSEILNLLQSPEWPDPVPSIVEAQRISESRVSVFPIVVIWARSPERAARNPAMLVLFGTEEEPGVFWRFIGMVWGVRRALVQVGEAVAVDEFLEKYGDEAPKLQAKRLKLTLRRWAFREQQVVRGPRQKSHRWLRRLVLRSSRMQDVIKDAARDEGVATEVIELKLSKKFDKMAARFSYSVLMVMRGITSWVLGLLYKEIDIREEDLERIRTAKREGVAVLAPCHRSHLDYLLMSTILWDHDIVPPHVVAGENLSFFPFGPLLRRSGAFFIPRRFTDKKFISLFSSYVTQLFREGYMMEFFIEGGRSRTGKLLRAKLGVLRNTVDAGVESRVGRSLAEVSWLPINIAYERVAEENPYRRELGGEKKAKESFGEVVKASKVLFQRHGRVSVRVAEPIKLSDLMKSWSCGWEEMGKEQQREVLQGLGEEILWRINQQAVVLPSALLAATLLAKMTPIMTVESMERRTECFYDFLCNVGAIPEAETEIDYRPLNKAAARFIQARFTKRTHTEEGVVYEVDPSKRITLEYYKNGIVHYFVPASLMSIAIEANGAETFTLSELSADLIYLFYILRYEFVHDTGARAELLEERALENLSKVGALSAQGKSDSGDDQWRVESHETVTEFAELTLNFIESYDLVLCGLVYFSERKYSNLSKDIQKFGRTGEGREYVERPEALSLINIQNALKAFREDGIYSESEGGGSLSVDGASIERYRQRFGRFLGKE
jgi:glycerol-3-phosphate O-acyltransferase